MAGKRTMESGRTKKGKNFYFYNGTYVHTKPTNFTQSWNFMW
mgnify:CR=1 FL=1